MLVDELRRYELYIVFQPDLEDEQLETRIERVNGFLTAGEGVIVEVVRRGRRRLAYPIRKHNQGIDVIYQANLPSSRLEVIERQLNLYEDVLRYLVVRRDDLEEGETLLVPDEQIAEEVANLQAGLPETEPVDEGETEAEDVTEPVGPIAPQGVVATGGEEPASPGEVPPVASMALNETETAPGAVFPQLAGSDPADSDETAQAADDAEGINEVGEEI
jgi:small subunit ribosomal protein S6